jgi:hypothetical protein
MSQDARETIQLSDQFEHLRLILESEQNRPVTYSEAVDVGDSLLSFFHILADEGGDPSDFNVEQG